MELAVSLASDNQTLRLALINTRSLANKTFLLDDFTLQELYFMFLMETWLHAGELTPFSELLPPLVIFSAPPPLNIGVSISPLSGGSISQLLQL